MVSHETFGFCIDWSSLEGYTLASSGELRKLECYAFSDKYDCLTWPNSLYELEGQYYQINDSTLNGDTALIFVHRRHGKLLTQLVTIGFLDDPDCHDIVPYRCPDRW